MPLPSHAALSHIGQCHGFSWLSDSADFDRYASPDEDDQQIAQVQLTDDVLRFQSDLTDRDIMAAHCCGQVSTVLQLFAGDFAGLALPEVLLDGQLCRGKFLHQVRQDLGAADTAVDVIRTSLNSGQAHVYGMDSIPIPSLQSLEDIDEAQAVDCLQSWVFIKSSMSTLLNISTCKSGVSGPSLLLKPRTFAFVVPRFRAVLNLGNDIEKVLLAAI